MKQLIAYDIINPCNEDFNYDNPSTIRILNSIFLKKMNTLVDRFDILNKNSEFYLKTRGDSIDKIIGLKSLSFKDCCEKRTEEIVSLANRINKDIYISWSGGVDSTLVICCLLMSSIDKNKIHILHTSESIKEYPFFYELLQKQKIKCYNIYNNIDKTIDIVGSNIFVNGLCGDQMDNYNISLRYKNLVTHFDYWKTALSKIISTNYKQHLDRIISDVEDYAKQFQINLNLFGEFTWLVNYGIKWTYEAEFFKSFFEIPNNCMAFFDTDYFSHYGMMNFHQKSIKQRNSSYEYKTDWKKLIYKYTKDDNYFLYKGKDMTFEKNDNTWGGLSVVDSEGYHFYRNIDSNKAKNIMLDYVKPEYKEYYNLIIKDSYHCI